MLDPGNRRHVVGFAGVTDAVAVGVLLAGVRSIGAVVHGDADAIGVVITDELPSGLTFGGYLSNLYGTAQLPDPDGIISGEYPVGSSMSYTFVFSITVTAGTLAYEADAMNVTHLRPPAATVAPTTRSLASNKDTSTSTYHSSCAVLGWA